MTLDDIAEAARAAAEPWAAFPHRAAALRAVADALDAAVDELVALAEAETFLGVERLTGEVARTTGQLRMFAERVDDGGYVDAIISPAADIRRMLVPVGPVAVFAASNFPFAFSVAGGDTASALAAGCPVVVKTHELHPRTSARTAELVTDALRAAGAPDGVFGTVTTQEEGGALVRHPAIRAAGFTGSLAGGRALFDLCAARPDPIPFFGELGSVNPVVVLPAAALEQPEELAQGYVASLTLGVGQFCTNPGLLFAPRDDRFVAAVADAVAASRGGPMLGERIRDAYTRETSAPEWTALDLLGHGAEQAGVRPEIRTVGIDDFDGGVHEVFGPAGIVVTYDDVHALLPVLRRLPGSLAATVHAAGDDRPQVEAVAAALAPTTGRLVLNGWPTGVAVCWAMHHGGPWPATSAAAHTSVGATAMRRWLVPIAYQGWPDDLLPTALQDANPLGLPRLVQLG